MDDIKVSVFLLIFNHEKYLRETLDSIVNQKTNFKFEVLVHDDASKDKSKEIIKEYEKKYPNLIRPIFQEENQFSKGTVLIIQDCLMPLAKGKYFAICEGDDKWIDEKKLQKQYDYMEKHLDCSLCVTNYIDISSEGEFIKKVFETKEDRTVLPKEIIERPMSFSMNGTFFAPLDLGKKIPREYFYRSVDDYPWELWFLRKGKVHILKDMTAAKRVRSETSFSARANLQSVNKNVLEFKRFINVIEKFNLDTEYIYKTSCKKAIAYLKCRILLEFFKDNNFYSILFKNCNESNGKKEFKF